MRVRVRSLPSADAQAEAAAAWWQENRPNAPLLFAEDYYVHDRVHAEVLILAVWSAVRGKRPHLELP